jgi:peptidoglycan hydrolase-like protein with peptidoglycan-binding domain
MKGVKLMGKWRHGRLAALGATTLAAAIAAAGFASGTASAAAAKPGTIAAAGATSAAARQTAPTAAASYTYTPSARNLREGMTGPDVKALQSRLAALKYYPGPIDGAFGSDTLEAVWAFQEVQRLTVNGIVGTATKYALVHPRPYPTRYTHVPTRVEVNLTVRVLVFIHDHTIALISHVSTGGHYWYPCGSGECFANTPTGSFRALYFIKGWHHAALGYMYNPVYFNYSGYAIHGEYNAQVPVNPVSHGCVRIPFDIAQWFYRDLHITENGSGTPIYIYK